LNSRRCPSIFFLFQEDVIAAFFNKIGGYLTLTITLFSVIIGAILKFLQARKDVLNKMIRTIGKGKLMDMLLKLNEVSDKVPMAMLDAYLDKFSVETGMKEVASNLSEILNMKRVLHEPTATEVLAEYKKKHDYGIITNKKRWNELRKDPAIDKALDALVKHLVEKFVMQAEAAKAKGNVDQIKKLIDSINNDKNIKKNREMRKKLEMFNEKLRTQEKNADLTKIGKELFEMFKHRGL